MDPDTWRDRVRTLDTWSDADELAHLIEDVDVARQPITLLVAMGTRWRLLGGEPAEFLLRVHQAYPNDFWLNFELGFLYGAKKDNAMAMSFNRAAVALRPDAPAPRFNLGHNLFLLERYDDAIYQFRRVIESDPNHTWAHFNLAELLLGVGQLNEAYAEYERTAELDPSARNTRIRQREILVLQGRGKEALESWAKAFYADDATYEECDGYPVLCLILERDDEYRRACARMVERFGDTTDPQRCEVMGRACVMGPASAEVIKQGQALIDRGLATDNAPDGDWLRPYILFAKALAEYRSERFERALEICEGEAASVLGPAPELVAAMAHHQFGNEQAARKALAEANTEFDGSGDSVRDRENWLYHVLRREALALIDANQQ
jgi:eukaryotic-like serine/threonine-protein kinase